MIDQLLERCVSYMGNVECRHCGNEVYPIEEEAREMARDWIEMRYVSDIDTLRQAIDRTCDHCQHMLNKDD
jgi:hypothetical protein